MSRVLIVYATREGHTRRIADRLAGGLGVQGLDPQVVDAQRLPVDFSMDGFDGAVLAGSLHGAGHEVELALFATKFREALAQIPTVFLSVSLSEVGAEDPKRSAEMRAKAQADVQRCIDQFLTQTGFRPGVARGVAGALPYSKYNPIMRFFMRRIVEKEGGDTDTSRDYEYTDWKALDQLAREFANQLHSDPFVSTLMSSMATSS